MTTEQKSDPLRRSLIRIVKGANTTRQAMIEKADNLKTIEATPQAILEATEAVIKHMEALKEQARLIEAYKGKEQESNAVLVDVVQDMNNALTVASNIKVFLLTDTDFIFEVLTEGQEGAIKEALTKLNLPFRKKYIRWMGGQLKD